jgi:CBS domain-containing protein
LKAPLDRRIEELMSEGEKSGSAEPKAIESEVHSPSTGESSGPKPETAASASPAELSGAASAEEAAPVVEPPPDQEPESEIEDVEPVVERPKSTSPHAPGHHLPPPPPSIRVKGAAGGKPRLIDVAGNPKLAQDLMTRKLFTIGKDDVIAHLEEHMEAFRFRHLPVVEDRKLVGLISHADLLRVSASLFSAKAKLQDELIHQLPAKHVMQRELVTVRPTDTLEHVAKVMWEGKLGCVLVTEADGTLVGIITEGDFIRLAHHFLVQERTRQG